MKKTGIEDLTIEEKLRLICARDYWFTVDLDGKLPQIRVTDGPNGVRMPIDPTQWNGVRPSIAYPSVQTLANTWSVEYAEKIGEALSDDCKDLGADVLLGPGVNIKRSPFCGRNFEYFSEDPYLTGILAKEYISGLQKNGTGACVKHFCANNLEYNRMEQSSEVDERTLREIYYKPFEIALQAKPVSLMCAYNRINGIYASEYAKGFRLLREEFGFDGAIISDWRAVRNRAKSAVAGLDLEMPYDENHYERLKNDYHNGLISEETLNECAQRVIDMVFKCKQLGEDKSDKRSISERIELTREIAEEGIVLLKNNGILPLGKGKSVSMCGLFARPCAYKPERPEIVCGGGSGQVERLTPMFDIYELMKDKYGKDITYEPAFDDNGVDTAYMKPNLAIDNAAKSDVNIVFAGTGAKTEGEGNDRIDLKLHPVQVKTILDTASVNVNTIVVLFAGAAVDMSEWIEKVAAVLYVGFPGEEGGKAIVNVLTGAVNPSGKLTETFPLCGQDALSSIGSVNGKVTRYSEGLDVGYRYYDTYAVKVLFPFGFGLSYSRFLYKNLSLRKSDDCALNVNYEIENVSDVDGKEVSQVYVRACAPNVYRPKKELKGFSKDFIGARSSNSIKIRLEKDSFSYWSTAKNEWVVDDGIYEIIVGSSCNDELLKGRIKIENGEMIVL